MRGPVPDDDEHAEIGGYLTETQPPDEVIHFISSGLYYRVNLPWLRQPLAPRATEAPAAQAIGSY